MLMESRMVGGTYVGTVGRERRRETGAVLIDVPLLRVQTAVVVSRVVPVGYTRVSRSEDDTDTLQRQLHPLATLALLVESRECTFNLAVRDGDDVADRRSATLQGTSVGTWRIIGVRVSWINVWLVSTFL
jgi:hypothetical protein